MNRAIQGILAVLLAIGLAVLAGCSVVDFFSTDNLLRAPKLTGDNAALQQAFERAVGKDVFLVSPLTGEYRSAFIKKDCNGDGVEEAIVFYVKSGTENTVHMHFLEYADGQWQSVADATGNGSEVYQAEFCEIDRGAAPELAVTWTVSDTKRDKTLSLYKIDFQHSASGDVFNPLASVQIFDYKVLDIDGDGQNEVFYVYFDSTEEKSGAYAKLLKYSETEILLYPVSEVKFDGRASNLLAVKYDLFDGKYEIFVDCAAGENAFFTEIVAYEPEMYALTLPAGVFADDSLAITRRSSLLYSEDINDDGLIEVPVEKTLDASFVVNDPDSDVSPLRYISWQRFEEGGFSPVTNYYFSGTGLYSICLDPFIDELYMIADAQNGEVQFRSDRANEEASGGTPPANEQADGQTEEREQETGEAAAARSDLLFTVAIAPERPERLPDAGNEIQITIGDYGKAHGITKQYIESLIEKDG